MKHRHSIPPDDRDEGILRRILTATKFFLDQRVGVVVLSTILLSMVWGYHGDLDLVRLVMPSWNFPCQAGCARTPVLPFVPWDRELISFWGGAALLVFVPVLIIKLHFKQPLRMYGLALPPKARRGDAWIVFAVFMTVAAVSMVFAARDHAMQELYPFYKKFNSVPQFAVYELCYFPFFLAIEFAFRGYLLFGVADNPLVAESEGRHSSTVRLRWYGVIVSMLAYNTWHLGKPLTELWATPVWGLAAGTVTYALRSVWPVLAVHFLMNVLLDALILHNLGILF